MAEDECEGIENALNLIVCTADRSGKMKKELKQTIFDTVSTLRDLFMQLKTSRDSKTQTISDLEGRVASMEAELAASIDTATKVHRETSSSTTQGPVRVNTMAEAPPAGGGRKLFTEILANGRTAQRFTITVTSKDKQTSETIKEILKTNINPTEIKVGINALKTLRNGKVLIETNTKEELETLDKDINDKCGDRLETHIHKLRHPRLVILNIPDDITTSNIEGTLIAQNPGLNLANGDINAKFTYVTKKQTRNLVVEVRAQVRKALLQNKVKIGWLICRIEDYISVNRCFKCSRYNHRARDCRGEETCPLCAGKHKLRDCTASPHEYKCVNCTTYSKFNPTKPVCSNHSSLDRNCPSLQALLEKYKLNTDYGHGC